MDPYEHDDVECIHQEVHIEAKPVKSKLVQVKWKWAIQRTIHRRRAIIALEKAREVKQENLRTVNNRVTFK